MANLYLLFSKALQNYVITMKSGEETTFATTLLMSLLNCYGLLRGGNLLEIVVVMGGMVARWASLLATHDGLPSLGEHWLWLQLGQGLVAAQRRVRGNFEEKSLFWLIHMDTSKIWFFFYRYDPSCLIQFKLSSQAYLLFSIL